MSWDTTPMAPAGRGPAVTPAREAQARGVAATARVGVLGGGQLGFMLGLAGIPLGIACRFWEPAAGASAGVVGEVVHAGWDDLDALRRFTDGLDAATWEVETVPASTASRVAEAVEVRPGPGWLTLGGVRHVEKATFEAAGIATARWVAVPSIRALHGALELLGGPLLLKSSRLGYDGRGQRMVRGAWAAAEAWEQLGLPEHDTGEPVAIAEQVVDFDRELAILAVRGDVETRFYPLVETRQRGGQLHTALAPCPGWTLELQTQAEAMVERLLAHGDEVSAAPYRGVLALELFQAGDRLVANEMAPRVHNSGHWSIEGAATSQFENHLRAVCGMPLGSTEAPRPSALVNLVGRLPDLGRLLALPEARVHLYGKAAKPGRKLGHVTVVGGDEADRDHLLAAVESLLPPP